MKGMALDAIHHDLVRTLGKGTVAYWTVTKYTRSAQFSGRKEATPPKAPDVERRPVDEAILTTLAEFPFSSVGEFSRRICLSRSTMHPHRHQYLTQSLRFVVPHLRWAPHFLAPKQKQIQIQMAIELLQVLSVQSMRQCRDFITLDKLWIYLFSEHDLMWIAPGEIVFDRERDTVESPKFMLTVVWNPIGFHVPCSESPPEGAQIQCTILYKRYLGHNLRLEAVDRGNTAEQVVGAF
jgi:hypothetical protein